MSEQTAQKAHHWLLVGFVSPQAQKWIQECGGQVKQVSEEPRLFTVGLAYDPAGKWVYSKGKPQLRQGVEFWTTGEIQEASTGINLIWKCKSANIAAEYCSGDDTYLILPDEEYDASSGTVKEAGQYTNDPLESLAPGSPGDHPF